MEPTDRLPEESHLDPETICPMIGTFVRYLGNKLDEAERIRILVPVLQRIAGTRDTEADEDLRFWLATDWLVRECAPGFLSTIPELQSHEDAIRALDEITIESVGVAKPVLEAAIAAIEHRVDLLGDASEPKGEKEDQPVTMEVAWDIAERMAKRKAKKAAQSVVKIVAGDAIGRAAQSAVREMARISTRAEIRSDDTRFFAKAVASDAVLFTARVTAQDAAWDVLSIKCLNQAKVAAWEAAKLALPDEARAVANEAARDVIEAYTDTAKSKARDAAKAALEPVVAALQGSAAEMILKMCAVNM